MRKLFLLLTGLTCMATSSLYAASAASATTQMNAPVSSPFRATPGAVSNINQVAMPYAYYWSARQPAPYSVYALTHGNANPAADPLTSSSLALPAHQPRIDVNALALSDHLVPSITPYAYNDVLKPSERWDCCINGQVIYSPGYRNAVELDRYIFEAMRREQHRSSRHHK